MPTPIEILLDPLSLTVIAMYLGLAVWEALCPARRLPKVRFWKVKGIASFMIFFYLSSYLPLFIDPVLGTYQLFDLSSLSTWAGAAIGVLVYELGLYLWHRAMHATDFLWRTFHQMHHSAERTDTYGAFYFSPLDMLGFIVLGSLCFALLVGLPPSSITFVLLITNFFSVFQHANIRTPKWLGYFVQRPESHAYHHARGIHRDNYSDLPIFDLLFGTFTNPRDYDHEAGFYSGASGMVKEMLLFQDISSPKPESTAIMQSVESGASPREKYTETV